MKTPEILRCYRYYIACGNTQMVDQAKECYEGIKDVRVKCAIYLRYLAPIEPGEKLPSWEKVAEGIGDGSTENSIRIAVSRYFSCAK